MKKNFNVNISGQIFHIDEDAFFALNQYLDRLRSHFAANPGKDEIITDIESRIAEMLLERIPGPENIVTLEDIRAVIRIMGEPTDFGEEESDETVGSETQGYKRLFRNPDDQVLGGVSGGLGAYFNLDPLWFRLGFIILTLIGGSGVLIYAVLWIAVPLARSTADKLRMKGENVTISNIERTLRDEFNGIKDSFSKMSFGRKKKHAPGHEQSTSSRFLSDTVRGLAKVVASISGAVFILMGIMFAILLLVLYANQGVLPLDGNEVFIGIPSLLTWVEAAGHDSGLIFVGLICFVATPVIILLYAGLRLIFGKQVRVRAAFPTLFIIWLIGTAILAVIGSRIGLQNHEYDIERDAAITLLPDSTHNLHLTAIVGQELPESVYEEQHRYSQTDFRLPVDHQDSLFIGLSEIEIYPSNDTITQLVVIREALGYDQFDASGNLQAINFSLNIDTGHCSLSQYFKVVSRNGWKNHRLRFRLYLSEDVNLTVDNKLTGNIMIPKYIIQQRRAHVFRNEGGLIRSVQPQLSYLEDSSPAGMTISNIHFLLN